MVTVMSPIVLRSSSGILTITPDEKGVGGWCQAHLLLACESRPLGAETLRYIASSLVAFLTESETKQGLRSVLGLSELHTSAFGEHVAGRAVLHLQDADGKMFAKLVLTPTEKSQWMQELVVHTGRAI